MCSALTNGAEVGVSGTGKHAGAPVPWFPTRLGVTTAVVTVLAGTMIIAAVATHSVGSRSTSGPGPAAIKTVATWAIVTANAEPALIRRGPGSPAVTRDCPAAAAACVDLARHTTWLQAHGKVTFGPVQMEPGKPGSAHTTPRGTFWVQWKAGPSLVSNIYHEPMPWAVFFAPGGIAFHGGSLTAWSHGCVHLTVRNAHYYNQHLPIGAEVFVF
jgi:hypothetical protein